MGDACQHLTTRLDFASRAEKLTANMLCLRYHVSVPDLERITVNPDVMGGKACIRGMRVTVGMIVEAIAAGRTTRDLLDDFPYLEEQDIREALTYAALLAQGREVRLAS